MPYQLLKPSLTLLQRIKIALAPCNIIRIELQALNKVSILHSAGVRLGLVLADLLLLLGLINVLVTATAHNASNGLMGDLTTGSESHALDHGAHESAEETGLGLGLGGLLGGGSGRGGGR